MMKLILGRNLIIDIDNHSVFLKKYKTFYPLGILSRYLFNFQIFLLKLVNIFFKNKREDLNFTLIKGVKVFRGKISNKEKSYIFLRESSKSSFNLSALNLADFYLNGQKVINSPKIYDISYESKKTIIIKMEFILGEKKLYHQLSAKHFEILKNLYKSGYKTTYSDRLNNFTKSFDENVKVYSGILHGDFTPFNILFYNDTYSLIDWEESEERGPIFYDLIYYYISNYVLFNIDTTKEIILNSICSFIKMINLNASAKLIKCDLSQILIYMKRKKINHKMIIFWQLLLNEISHSDIEKILQKNQFINLNE